MSNLAIIGGSGLTSLVGLKIERRQMVHTPYGSPSGPILHGIYQGKAVKFIPRHGQKHTIPPHRVNYRANLWALQSVGVDKIIAVSAVGAINAHMQATDLVIPHQLIDYTVGRDHTFFEDTERSVTHIDFTHPYCENLRQQLLQAATETDLVVHEQGVYATTQGPRLETAAEVDRLARDGCDIVGMTGMPEAALAKELDLCYAACAVVSNPAAGRGTETLTLDGIRAHLIDGIENVRQLLAHVIPKVV
jgi:5'-methylthioinosine phosphorylase